MCAKKKSVAKKIKAASVALERDEAYAVLCGLSMAIDACGGSPPDELHDPLYRAVTKLKEAFRFKKGDRS